MPQTSEMNLNKNRLKIGKYASRDSKSSVGDKFTVPITGLFYDQGDNYDLSSNTASFKTEKVWDSQRYKNQYGKFKLKRQ